MITISLHEAKAQFSSLITSVERQGERVVILKHGVAVAEIVPLKHSKRTTLHRELKNIRIRFDPLESTEKEWADD